jgi:hypothetical protein
MGTTWETPSPESNTTPVSMPLPNLICIINTMKALPELGWPLRELPTSQRKFTAFSFDASLGWKEPQ